MTRASKIQIVQPRPEPKTVDISDITAGTAFTGKLMGLYGSPYTGVFLMQGRQLVALSCTDIDGKDSGTEPGSKPGNVFFAKDHGTVEDFQEVDLEIKVVPHVG